MKSRIDTIFTRLRQKGHGGLMPFITGGYPTLDDTAAVLPALAEAGASIVEIGIPFSDPIADGPVIAGSMFEALQAGVTPDRVFDVVANVRAQVDAGLIAMVSHSIVNRIGTTTFLDRCTSSGIDGIIMPDTDIVSAEVIAKQTQKRDLTFTMLIAPTTSEERIARLAKLSSGFLYLLARSGITGERDDVPDVGPRIDLIRRHTDLPIAVGFGISRAEHVAAVTATADAAIVGSALVRRMGSAKDPTKAAVALVRELMAGCVR